MSSPAPAPRIRAATRADLPLLQDIEAAAGAPFRDHDMAWIADDAPPALDILDGFRRAGRAWVVTDADDRPVAYLILEPVDGATHIEQVSVHPDAARRGLGRALIDHAANATGAPLTLTTFAEIPWNAPYYERIGFRVLADDELTGGLRRIRAHESELGLDARPRVCMRRDHRPRT